MCLPSYLKKSEGQGFCPTMQDHQDVSPGLLEKDAGFCSGDDDDESEESNRSNSDDSGLKMGRALVTKIIKNKRKCAEPLKRVNKTDYASTPLKKRIRFSADSEAEGSLSNGGEREAWREKESDLRPWEDESRVPEHPGVRPPSPRPSRSFFSVDALLAAPKTSKISVNEPLPPPPPPREQRNYKNMTRERRIEANARERTRVHTISAAFDTLRQSIPAYSHNQKLSKLSVLRIACSYILALSRVAEGDDESDSSSNTAGSSADVNNSNGDQTKESNKDGPTLAECVESVSKTIQTEGKLRKRRDDI